MPQPDFIIIGAMKAATSSLHDQLAQQPGIFMTTPKEPYYFSNDEVYAQGEEWYRSLYQDAAPTDLTGESSTHYTKLPTYPHTVERLQQYAPEVKLIYVLRHPIDRVISHYVHDWSENKLRAPIDDAILNYPDLINYSRYTFQLRPFITAFGCARILLVPFDGIRNDPQSELERIGRFIGYPGQPHWQTAVTAQNVSSQRLRKNRLRDALVWNPVVTALRRTLVPQSFRERIKGLWQMKERPLLSAASSERLTQIFDEDLGQLGQWVGRSITCRNFKTATTAAPLDWSEPVALSPLPTSSGHTS